MISLLSLDMKNFLSHLDSHIDFNQYNGMTLISGINEDGRYDSNGSGKSTILEGVYYAFTGKTLRGLSADGIVNRVTGSDCEVTLIFILGTNTYRISRYRNHSKYGNLIRLFINEKDKSQRLPTDTQAMIDDLLDTPADILVGVMLMGEGLSSKFTSLSDPDKKRLLEQTIRMTHDIFLSDKQVSNELYKISSDISELSGYISACERSIELNNSVNVEEQDNIVQSKSDRESEIRELSDRLPICDTEISGLQDKINLINTTIGRISRLRSSVMTIQSNRDELTQRISNVSNSEKPICPACGQIVDDTTILISTLSRELDEVQNELTTTLEELHSLPEDHILVDKKRVLEQRLSESTRFRDETRTKISEINNILMDLNTRLDRIERVKSQTQDLDAQIKESRSKLMDLNTRKNALDYIHKKLFSSTGIISDILMSVIQFIDSRLSVYTNILLDKPMTIEMNNKGKISLVSTNGEYTYNSLSNGEKRRLDISIQFALHDYCYLHCGLGLNTLFIDEVLDTLDSVGVSNILQVLRMKMDFCNLSHIFIVTHNDDLKAYFDSSIIVSKDSRGITTIIKD